MTKGNKLEEVKEVKKEEKKVEKLSDFLQAYKLQNPVKYEAKKARGELKGL